MTIDNPANYILVKDTEEFLDMLKRRGYRLEEHKDMYGMCYKITVGDKAQVTQYALREYSFLYKSVADVAEDLDKWIGAGQHHVCCAQCKEPLLRKVCVVDCTFHPDQVLEWRGGVIVVEEYRLEAKGPKAHRVEWIVTLNDRQMNMVNASRSYVEYRSTKLGPDSLVLAECPTCGVLLDGNTEEIRDNER